LPQDVSSARAARLAQQPQRQQDDTDADRRVRDVEGRPIVPRGVKLHEIDHVSEREPVPQVPQRAAEDERERRGGEPLAVLAPQPDVPSSVRKLPILTAMPFASAPLAQATPNLSSEPTAAIAPSPAAFVPTPRPIVRATAPERYRVQFTMGEETHNKFRRLQGLLRREDRGHDVRCDPAPR